MTRPPVPDLGTVPQRTMAAEVYETAADAFMGKLPGFGNGANALGSWMEGTADAVQANADAASSAAAAALAAASYKGAWPSLTGSLGIPASSSHANKVWMLTEDVADVTAEEPGVSAKWLLLTTVGVTRYTMLSSADSLTLSVRDFVTLTAAGKTVTLPPDAPLGAECGAAWGDWVDTMLDGNGQDIIDADGVAHADFALNVLNDSVQLIKTTQGWIFQ